LFAQYLDASGEPLLQEAAAAVGFESDCATRANVVALCAGGAWQRLQVSLQVSKA